MEGRTHQNYLERLELVLHKVPKKRLERVTRGKYGKEYLKKRKGKEKGKNQKLIL